MFEPERVGLVQIDGLVSALLNRRESLETRLTTQLEAFKEKYLSDNA